MVKGPSTSFGEPLSLESKQLVNELRSRIRAGGDNIPDIYDTEFNIYRWLMTAERQLRCEKDVMDSAEKALRNHIKYRRTLKLDEEPVPSWDENPIFARRLMPRGEILDQTDRQNRLLWYIDYESVNVEGIAHSVQSSDMCKYQFWQFEVMLQKVMNQEAKTGHLSSLRHVVNMANYEINPFTMLFVSSGTLAYYSQLLHFDHYPELVSPAEMVNIARWIHVPYRLARTMMPHGFTERFRLHDAHFLPLLLKDMSIEQVPSCLGGQGPPMQCVPARAPDENEPWTPSAHDEFEFGNEITLLVNARKRKVVTIRVTQPNTTISWYFHTDSDIFFGVYYQADNEKEIGSHPKASEIDQLEMVYPWFKTAAKIVPEKNMLACEKTGRYLLVFCNKQSWFGRRTVHLKIDTETENEKVDNVRKKSRKLIERTLSC